MYSADIETLASFCRDNLELTDVQYGDEYYYANLPLCVIDAIYSINARYASTQATVKRFGAYFNVQEMKHADSAVQAQAVEFTIDDLLDIYAQHSVEFMASDVYRARHSKSRSSIACRANPEQVRRECPRRYARGHQQRSVRGRV
jgi:uncharacterized iron-regulated protein